MQNMENPSLQTASLMSMRISQSCIGCLRTRSNQTDVSLGTSNQRLAYHYYSQTICPSLSLRPGQILFETYPKLLITQFCATEYECNDKHVVVHGTYLNLISISSCFSRWSILLLGRAVICGRIAQSGGGEDVADLTDDILLPEIA